MAKKPSGLGRGLGELLEDNTPEIRQGQGSAVRKEVSAPSSAKVSTPAPNSNAYTNLPPKSLYESKPKNKSLKANFKNFNR